MYLEKIFARVIWRRQVIPYKSNSYCVSLFCPHPAISHYDSRSKTIHLPPAPQTMTSSSSRLAIRASFLSNRIMVRSSTVASDDQDERDPWTENEEINKSFQPALNMH